jgi:hypothetical protein
MQSSGKFGEATSIRTCPTRRYTSLTKSNLLSHKRHWKLGFRDTATVTFSLNCICSNFSELALETRYRPDREKDTSFSVTSAEQDILNVRHRYRKHSKHGVRLQVSNDRKICPIDFSLRLLVELARILRPGELCKRSTVESA